jgi:uncharacterized membrane protein
MANSKARSNSRPAPAKAGKAAAASRSARTVSAVSATPTGRKVARPTVKAAELEPEPLEEEYDDYDEKPLRTSPPPWLQIVTFALAILGLGISAYETWAHFNGSHLAGCSIAKGSTFDCTAVITSPQSMVFGVIPVAVLGLAFYVAAVPLFSPWAWRIERPELGLIRLASVVIGMGFVMYLIYAEIYQIKQVCEYCSGVHIVTFLLFCITVFSAAIWELGARRDSAARA